MGVRLSGEEDHALPQALGFIPLSLDSGLEDPVAHGITRELHFLANSSSDHR